MTHLYIIRHGETEENAAGILQGHLPGHLTERGRRQAAGLRGRLTAMGLRPDALLCSDLARAVETARIVNEAFALPLRPTPLLRERDWGALTGARIDGLAGVREFPKSVESVEGMMRRARRLLEEILALYGGKRVLCVGHGLFNRCLIAAIEGRAHHEVPRMGNAEVRIKSFAALPAVPDKSAAGADRASAD